MPRKRVVTSKPTRSGCRTCRVRRIKCDEEQPSCRRCRNSARTCDYDVRVLSGGASHAPRILLPARSNSLSCSPISISPRSLSPTSPHLSYILSRSNSEDRQAYDFFLTRSFHDIGSTSPSGSAWVQMALQSCNNKHIFYSVAALASAHRSTLDQVSHFTLNRYVLPENLNAALQQYGKAMSALQDYISDVAERQAAIEPVLLACLLLVAFELLVDQKSSAYGHYHLGRRIADQSLKAAAERGPESSSLRTIKQLAAAFRSIGYGAEHYWSEYVKTTVGSTVCPPRVPGSMPMAFNSFIEADVCLQSIVRSGEEAMRVMVKLSQAFIGRHYGVNMDLAVSYCLANCLSRSIDIPASLQRRLEEIMQAHSVWKQMLQACIERQRSSPDPILPLTQVRYFASWLVIATSRQTKEVLIDRFEHQFTPILDRAETYLRQVSGSPHPERPPQMRAVGASLESGILPTLNIIAAKSRRSKIRRRALNMLVQSGRLEGTFHSGVIESHVSCIMDIEETKATDNLGNPDSRRRELASAQVPEQARFADFVVKGTPGLPSTFRLVCARYLHDIHSQIEITEYLNEGMPLRPQLLRTKVFGPSEVLQEKVVAKLPILPGRQERISVAG